MSNELTGALAAALGLAVAAAAQTQDSFPAAAVPQLQLTELTGEIRVSDVDERETVAGKTLPYIRSGSLVRVLSGRAEFESDYHAVVTAKKGDAFRFTGTAPEGSKPGVVRIAAAAPRGTPSLRVAVGGKNFRLHKGGAVEVAGTARGESTVRSEGGTPQSPAVEVSQDGAMMASAQGLPPGRSLAVSVDRHSNFENAPASLASLAVSREDDRTYTVRAQHLGENTQAPREDRVDEAIASWPSASRTTVGLMVSKYGMPDRVSSSKLVWENSSPWSETTVYRVGSQHGFPLAHEDVLRQSVAYEVPREKGPDLARMDIGVTVDRGYKGFAADGDSEESNFLAANLAVDVIKGDRTPEQARNFFTKTIELSGAGKTSPYTQGLLFQRP